MTTVKEKDNPRLEQEEIIDFEEVGTRRAAPRDIKLNETWERNRNLIAGGIVAVMLGVGGYFGYNWYINSQEEKASDDVLYAFKYYEKDSLDKAINGNKPYKGAKALADEYSGTKTGALAKYMLATSYLNQGKIKEGVALLEEYQKDNDNMVSATAYEALGYGYEELKQFDKAAEAYLSASKVNENSITTPEYLMRAARCYEELKNNDKALSLYKEIKKKYPVSEAGSQVEKYIAKLGGELE